MSNPMKVYRSGPVHVVGGAGYIGTHLCAALRRSYEPRVWDFGLYAPTHNAGVRCDAENGPCACGAWHDRNDIRSIDPPGDGRPVIWLASPHKEPPGLGPEDKDKWLIYGAQLVEAAHEWHAAGHPLIYVSSTSVLTDSRSAYADVKEYGEASLVANLGTKIIRFGTVVGGLHDDPCRPQTVPNRWALTGERPDENYGAFVTRLEDATKAIVDALSVPFLGTVTNVVADYFTAASFDYPPMWLLAERDGAPRADEGAPCRYDALVNQPHPSLLLAKKVGLPHQEIDS